MRNLWGNVRYALRQFRASPVFAAAAVLTLALGIGGTTAIFTLIDAVMLRSLPVMDPARRPAAVRGTTSLGGSDVLREGHPLTVIGIAPPGFFGETLRSDPTDIWIPLQQEAMMDGDRNLLTAPFSGWLRIIGRLRPGASTAGMAPRLTAL